METRHEQIAGIIIGHSLSSGEAVPAAKFAKISSSKTIGTSYSGKNFRVTPCHGGCISTAECFEFDDGQRYFVKSMPRKASFASDLFDAEVNGLLALQEAGVIRVPSILMRHRVETRSEFDGEELLILEYLQQSAPSGDFFESFGQQLADLHQPTKQKTFGWYQDNFIGKSPQYNQSNGNVYTEWPVFFAEMRIQPQLNMLQQSGGITPEFNRLADKLVTRLPELLATNQSFPSLLHGDLWNGNFLSDADGRVAIFDPAVYHGHRECEFALPMMFGGFPSCFYEAYQESLPMESGWRERVELYQLYHLLNHTNLFGDSYLANCLRILRKYA
ncbi:MAG: fructosamine kinase family protein [Aureliella sp.]